MAVITARNLSGQALGHTRDVDVIGQDGPERRTLPAWLADRAVRLVGAAALLVTGAGVVVAAQGAPVVAAMQPRPPVSVGVVFDGGDVQRRGDGAAGALQLLVVNRTARPAPVRALTLEAAGLEVLSVEPGDSLPLGAFAQRKYVVRYSVPDCARLRLPGRVSVGLRDPDADRVKSMTVPLMDPSTPGDGVPFAPCPGTAAPLSLGVRSLGGTTTRTPAGARGLVRVEVRNGGAPLLLLELTAEVPGVLFSPLVPANGISLLQDDRIELQLAFEIPDCDRLRRTGRLVLRASRGGVVSELGLTITNVREAGTVRQVALDRVLQACPL